MNSFSVPINEVKKVKQADAEDCQESLEENVSPHKKEKLAPKMDMCDIDDSDRIETSLSNESRNKRAKRIRKNKKRKITDNKEETFEKEVDGDDEVLTSNIETFKAMASSQFNEMEEQYSDAVDFALSFMKPLQGRLSINFVLSLQKSRKNLKITLESLEGVVILLVHHDNHYYVEIYHKLLQNFIKK